MAFIHGVTLPSGSEYNIEGTLYTVKGTQNSSTASWTGTSDLVALKSGVTIGYYLPYDSVANPTLNLTLKTTPSSTTGAIKVVGGDNAKAGNVVILTYYAAGDISIAGTATTDPCWICNGSFPYEIVTSINTSSPSNDKLPTEKAVSDLFSTIPTPMQFKGTVGTGGTTTWANLPTASGHEGWMYLVASDHSTDPVCKVGDIIISNGTTWLVAPAGDDPGTVDTWRAIYVDDTQKAGNATSTYNVDFISGTNVSISGSTKLLDPEDPDSVINTVTINATDTTYTATSSSVGSASNWNAGSAATLGTAIDADDITSWTTNTPTSFSVANEVLTITGGSAATLNYTAKSIPNVTDAGTAPSLTITDTTVVTAVTAN